MNGDEHVIVDGAPDVPDLVFRRFRGARDYPGMAAASAASAAADHDELASTVDDLPAQYANLVNCDPRRDLLIAEVAGALVGYARTWWWDDPKGPLVYESVGFLHPAWRRRGIGRAILGWLEGRQREIAAGHDRTREKVHHVFVAHDQVGLAALLDRAGYRPTRWVSLMVCPSLASPPDFALPSGLELRPLEPAHYRAMWDANIEAFHDDWLFVAPPTDADYEAFVANRTAFWPELCQVAWDTATGRIAGQVRAFIDEGQNQQHGRARGWIEVVSTSPGWAKRGVARALIASALRALRDRGMTECGIAVDSANPSGAGKVYEACGFRVDKRHAILRKPL